MRKETLSKTNIRPFTSVIREVIIFLNNSVKRKF